MIATWWIHLSFAHAALVVGLVVLVVLSFLLWVLAPRKSDGHGDDWKPWPVVDYSAGFERQRKWLGDDFLCAKPINRRGAQ